MKSNHNQILLETAIINHHKMKSFTNSFTEKRNAQESLNHSSAKSVICRSSGPNEAEIPTKKANSILDIQGRKS